jgi:hypothetical protein
MKNLILTIILSLALCSGVWAGQLVLDLDMEEASGNLTSKATGAIVCTANGGPDYQQTGPPNRGKAIGFDGSTDYFDCGTPAALDLTGNFTIMTWVYPQETGSGGIVAHDNGAGVANVSWYLQLNGGSIVQGAISDSSTYNLRNSPAYNLNQWYHYAFVVSTSQVILYVNAIAGTPLTRTIYAQSQPTWDSEVGVRGEAGLYAQALIDNIKIYNYALSATQILHEYQQSHLVTQLKHEP